MDGVTVFRFLFIGGEYGGAELPIVGTRGEILTIDTEYGRNLEYYDAWHPMRIREVAQAEYDARRAEVNEMADAFRAEHQAKAKPPRCHHCGNTDGYYAHRSRCPGLVAEWRAAMAARIR